MSLRGNQQHSNSTKTNDFTVFLHNTDSYIMYNFLTPNRATKLVQGSRDINTANITMIIELEI